MIPFEWCSLHVCFHFGANTWMIIIIIIPLHAEPYESTVSQCVCTQFSRSTNSSLRTVAVVRSILHLSNVMVTRLCRIQAFCKIQKCSQVERCSRSVHYIYICILAEIAFWTGKCRLESFFDCKISQLLYGFAKNGVKWMKMELNNSAGCTETSSSRCCMYCE